MTELDPKWIHVTTILSMIPTMGQNGNWCYPMQTINQDVLKNKANLGSSVHAAISAHVKDEFMPLSDKEDGYLNSYLKWEKSIGLRPTQSEQRLFYEPMRLTGAFDMLAKIGSSEKVYLIDFKCTASPDHVKWPLQAAFYEMLATLNRIKVEKTCLFVQLDQNSDHPKVHEYTITQTLTSSAISWYNSYMYLKNK